MAGEWVKDMSYTNSMGYYSFKRKETLSQATTQMNLESQILDDPNSDEISKAVKLIEAESRMTAARGGGCS